MDEKRVMALDIGTKRIGVALSDPLLISAQPLKTINSKTALSELESLSREYKVYKIIVGLPLELNGLIGEQAKSILAFVDKLAAALSAAQLDIEIKTLDERLSSKAAERVVIDSSLKGKARHEAVDKVAAAIILEQYLNSQRSFISE